MLIGEHTHSTNAPRPRGSPSPSILPLGPASCPASESSWSTSSHLLFRPIFSLNVGTPRSDTYVGANEDILYALSKDASSIEKFKRPMTKGYPAICAVKGARTWMNPRLGQSSNRPGHRPSKSSPSRLYRTSVGPDHTKQVPKSQLLRLRLNSSRGASLFASPETSKESESALNCRPLLRRSLILLLLSICSC